MNIGERHRNLLLKIIAGTKPKPSYKKAYVHSIHFHESLLHSIHYYNICIFRLKTRYSMHGTVAPNTI